MILPIKINNGRFRFQFLLNNKSFSRSTFFHFRLATSPFRPPYNKARKIISKTDHLYKALKQPFLTYKIYRPHLLLSFFWSFQLFLLAKCKDLPLLADCEALCQTSRLKFALYYHMLCAFDGSCIFLVILLNFPTCIRLYTTLSIYAAITPTTISLPMLFCKKFHKMRYRQRPTFCRYPFCLFTAQTNH